MQLIDQAMFTLAGLNLPDTLTPTEWTQLHGDILICKRTASKWLAQSRQYSTERWGTEFTADTEAQLELDLGLTQDQPATPQLNPSDKAKGIVTIEGLSTKFDLWKRKMDDEIPTWDRDRLSRALELLTPMEAEAARIRNLLTSK
jgi:hypothetical protein